MKFKSVVCIVITILFAYICAKPQFSHFFSVRAAIDKTDNDKENIIIVTDNSYDELYYDNDVKNEYLEPENGKVKTDQSITKTSVKTNSSDSSVQYSKSDLELLAHLIFAEANVFYNKETKSYENCSDTWQCYVACVALNRVKSKSFPNSLKEVIFQKGQYASVIDGNFKRTPNKRAYSNALKVLKGYRPLPENVIYQAEFKQGKGVFEKIGNTYFCY